MSRANTSHFTGEIERVHDDDDGTISLDIRASHVLRHVTDARPVMTAFLHRWAEAGCPPVHVHGDGHLSLVKNAGVSHRGAK